MNLLWPYDEVSLRPGEGASELLVDSPWLKAAVGLPEDEWRRASPLVDKFVQRTLGPNDLAEVQWLFGSLAKYPLCYLLPRAQWPTDLETFLLRGSALADETPAALLHACLAEGARAATGSVVARDLNPEWKWDCEAAHGFATTPAGLDPRAIFGVARRYHLLSATEGEGTQPLFATILQSKSDSGRFKAACALMLRQNHYVTERCQSALAPALEASPGARAKVEEFRQAEQGHDRILAAALGALGYPPAEVPVIAHSQVLMDLLEFAAGRNLLAFAIVVDFFERSAYQDSDPMAQVLRSGGEERAATFVDSHMNINDSGEHENVALGFLDTMGPVDAAYATEALRIAELTTLVMARLPWAVKESLGSWLAACFGPARL